MYYRPTIVGLLTLMVALSAARGDEKPWSKTLPGGIVVELLGVAHQFPGPNDWFSPDGKPLAEAPFDAPHIIIPPEDETKIMQFALRVKTPAGSDADFAWKFDPKGTPSQFNMRRTSTKRIAPDRLRLANEFLTPQVKCSIRFGVAAGPWKTIATAHSSGGWTEMGKPRIMFGKAHNLDGRTLIAVSYTDLEDAVRVVMLDDADKVHIATAVNVEGGEGSRLLDLQFEIPPTRAFAFQTRPYQWVTFADVALTPRK